MKLFPLSLRAATWFCAVAVVLIAFARPSQEKPPVLPQVAQMAVIYYHGPPNCVCTVPSVPAFDDNLERVAKEVVKIEFGRQLEAGSLVWRTADYQSSQYARERRVYKITRPCIVFSVAKNGKVVRWHKVSPATATDDQVALARQMTAEMRAFFRGAAEAKRSTK